MDRRLRTGETDGGIKLHDQQQHCLQASHLRHKKTTGTTVLQVVPTATKSSTYTHVQLHRNSLSSNSTHSKIGHVHVVDEVCIVGVGSKHPPLLFYTLVSNPPPLPLYTSVRHCSQQASHPCDKNDQTAPLVNPPAFHSLFRPRSYRSPRTQTKATGGGKKRG